MRFRVLVTDGDRVAIVGDYGTVLDARAAAVETLGEMGVGNYCEIRDNWTGKEIGTVGQ